MFKKIVVLVLSISLFLSIISPVSAINITDFSEKALMVSEEFAAQYPGGAFSLSAVTIKAKENSGRSVINVVRQGGAAGNMEVTVKAIDISAKYGQDYRLSVPGFILDRQIAGDETTPVIIQNGQTAVTGSGINNNSTTGAGANYNIQNGQTAVTGSGINSNSTTKAGANYVGADGKTGLRAAREQATGQASDREKLIAPGNGDQDLLKNAASAANDFYAEAPGTVFTLSFKNGERKKSFNLDIKNDAVPEAEEQIIFVITSVTEGGFLGMQKETTVNIIDDEPYEKPVLGFAAPVYTADGGKAVITFKRTAGVNYYAGALVTTIGDSATAGIDYTEQCQKILFVPGQLELSLEIPVTGNESGNVKCFYVKLQPDNSIALSGSETAQVIIPAKNNEAAQFLETGKMMAAAADKPLMAVSPAPDQGVYLGTGSTISYGYQGIARQEGSDSWHGDHSSGQWYEGLLKSKNMDARYYSKASYYMSYLDSVYVNYMLYDLGGYSSYFRAWMDGGFQGADNAPRITRNIFSAMNEYREKNKLRKSQIMGRGPAPDDSYSINWMLMPLNRGLQTPFVRAVNNNYGDKFAARIYSFEFNFRKFDFDVYQGFNDVYTIDLSNPTQNYTVETYNPGTFKIVSSDEQDAQSVKGIYTSEAHTVYMKSEIDPSHAAVGWYLKGVKFYDSEDMDNPALFQIDNEGKFVHVDYWRNEYKHNYNAGRLTFNNEWLRDYAYKYGKGGKFIIQPVYSRKPATISVSIRETDIGKGTIAGWVNSTTASTTLSAVTLKKSGEADKFYTLRTGDMVVLKGTGSGNYMIKGYNVSYNGNIAKDEAGSQSAGIITLMLAEKVSVTPIFGNQSLTLKRDPDFDKQYPDLKGDITYHGQITNGGFDGIRSGQYVEFVSIPPVKTDDKGNKTKYTTLWANRTGDTNENGVLDSIEIRNPKTHKLYRQFDYDGDNILDAEYDTPVYGDLFGYKVNQPNPLFYYYYEPLSGKTLYAGKVSGEVVTREYTIRQGYTKVKDENDEDVDKLVPVVGATVKMGGSFDPDNPDAQLGYSTSTDDTGAFEFNVANVIKNAYYLFSVDYNGSSYIDKINPSSYKQLIIPTFSSMKPTSITAVPRGGADNTVVSGSVVMLQDKTVSFTLLTASLENNVKVKNAIFRIYTKDGTLVPNPETADAPEITNKGIFKAAVDDQGRAVFTQNLNRYFTPNGKLTVQLEDQNGNRSMEYNSGFELRPAMLSTSMLPSFAAPYVKSIPLFESVMGKLDLGMASFADLTANDEGYTIYLGIGHDFDKKQKVLKDTFDKAKKGSGKNSTEEEKKEAETAKNEIKDENASTPKKEGSNVKVKSTIANSLGIKLSLRMNIKYDKNAPADVKSPYYFGDLLLMVTLTDSLKYETVIGLPVGVSIIIKLEVGGSVTGYIYISRHKSPLFPEPIKTYADENGCFPYNDSKIGSVNQKFDYEGGIILEPVISILGGVSYGIAEVDVWGTAKFNLVFSTSSSGSGTVTLNAGVTAKVMGFKVYGKTFGNWEYTLFGEEASVPASMFSANNINENAFEPIPRDYLNNRSGWIGDQVLLQASGQAGSDFTERPLMQGIYPEPDTQMIRIDEDSLLMVFIDDHSERTDENRGAVYYSISHDNGATFSRPVLLDNDGTLDSHPRLCDIGSRIVLVYSSLDKAIDEGISMEDILESHDLEMAFFDKSTHEFSAPVQITRNTSPDGSGLTGDYHSDMDASAVYDEQSGRLMIIFHKTDYTSDPDEEFNAFDLSGSYPAIVYMIYDTKTGNFVPYDESDYPAGLTEEQKSQWDAEWYGQRFLETAIVDDSLPEGGLTDPLILDLTAKTKDRIVYTAYTVDMDGDPETLQDRDIYLQTYSFDTKVWTSPFKMSDMDTDEQAKSDGKPQLIVYDGEMYLFFHAGTAIHYYDLDLLFAELNSPDREPIIAPDDPSTEQDESYSHDPDDYLPTAPRIALEYSAENLPSDDYQVLVGDDGRLYLVWTEETVRLADGVEPGSPDAAKPENIYHENQIFASMFYQDLDESAQTADVGRHYGKWSGKVQITAGPGSYEDADVCVMADGRMILAAKKSDVRSEDDNAGLVALTLTPVAQPELKQGSISFGTAYPRPNKVTTIVADVGNHGLEPLLDPAVDFYMVRDGAETKIGTGQNTGPVYGGYVSKVSMHWTVPDDIQGISIIARLRSGSGETVLAQAERELPYGTGLEYGLFNLEYVARDYYRAYIEVHHMGNKPLENAEMVISMVDVDKELHELKRIGIDDSEDALEMFVIDEGFNIPEEYLTDDTAEIQVTIESDGDILAKQTATAEKSLLDSYRDLIDSTTGIEFSGTNANMTSGMSNIALSSIYPLRNSVTNNIVYRSSNPEIVSVDNSGQISTHMDGTAVITAYVVPKADVSIQTSDGYAVAGDILDYLALNDCKSDALTVTVRSGAGAAPDVKTDEASVTKKIDSNGNVSLTAKPILNSNTSSASVVIDPDLLTAAFDSATTAKDGRKTVVLNIQEVKGAAAYEPTLPASFLTSGDPNRMVEIDTAIASVKVPGNMIAAAGGAQKVTMSISMADRTKLDRDIRTQIGDRPIIELGLKIDGVATSWNNDNVPVEVALPYSPTAEELRDPEHITVWYIDGAGNVVSVPSGRYDAVTGKVIFSTTHFSRYAVTLVNKTFKDIDNVAWAKKQIEVLASKGVINGTSQTTYTPAANITRADFLVLLVRTLGLTAKVDSNFADVKQGEYYYQALGIAKKLGISEGTGDNRFNPKESITRQEMMTMAARAMKIAGKLETKGTSVDLKAFSDKGIIAPYAVEAIAAMAREGLITGDGSRINPASKTTRAEAAVLLYRIYNK